MTLFFQETPVMTAALGLSIFEHGTSMTADTAHSAVCAAIVPSGSDNASLLANQNFQLRNSIISSIAQEGRLVFQDSLGGHLEAVVTQMITDLIHAAAF